MASFSSQYHFYHKHQTMLKSLFLFLISLCLVGRICGFGHVDPEIIYAFENELDATIECSFNLSQGDGLTSSDLFFNETCDSSRSVIYNTSDPNVEILSKNKIRIRLPNRAYSKCLYRCQTKKWHVAQTSVIVGKRLSNVKDFKCRSRDWQNMTCEFTEMDNYIPLKYNLTYKLDHRKTPFFHKCPLKNDSKRGRFCDVYTNDQYFRADDTFYFTLVSNYSEKTGLKGGHVERFEIDHLASIVPSAPDNVTTSNVMSNSAVLMFDISSHYQVSRVTFDYDVDITSVYHGKEWTKVSTNFTNVAANVTKLQIPLDYAFTDYNIRLRMKSHKAPNQTEMYSPYVYTNVMTNSKSPDRPPNSTFGAFYIHDDDSLTIYWQPLYKYEENGPNFRYTITGPSSQPKTMKNISADFSHLQLGSKSHKFDVWSVNSNGSSSNPLQILVPKKSDLLDVKISLVQTYNGTTIQYNLTWTCKGTEIDLIEKFVIFSCESISLNPNTCDKELRFNTVPSTQQSFMFPAEPKYIFAIAAYGRNRTTGLQWSECRSNLPDSIGKLFDVKVYEHYINRLSVKWMVDCSDKLIIKKFNVTVCEKDGVCQTHFANSTARGYLIEDLRPFTNYKVLVSMISTSGKQGVAVEDNEKTDETAPSEPRNLTYSKLTSNSVLLNWVAPDYIPGNIRHHRVYYYSYEFDASSNRTISHKHEKNMDTNSTSYVLDGLESFTKYDVYITACTIACSENSSNIIKFMTNIGAPEDMSAPKIDNQIISWKKPSHMRGNLTFYELKINYHIDGKEEEELYRIRNHRCRMLDRCPKGASEFHIRVRAVNVIAFDLNWDLIEDDSNDTINLCESDEILNDLSRYKLVPGEWNEERFNCIYGSLFSVSSLIRIGFILMVLVVLGTVFYIGYKKMSECSKLQIDLPDPLKEIHEIHSYKVSDSLFKRLFSKRTIPREPDIVFVQNPIVYDNPPQIVRDSVIDSFIDDTPPHRNEALEPLLSLTPLPRLEEALEEESLFQPPPVTNRTPITAPTQYVQMSALEKRPQLSNTGEYLPITRGFTQTNYVGNVLQKPPSSGFLMEMLKISQLQQNETPSIETSSFQQPQKPDSGYVLPGYTGS